MNVPGDGGKVSSTRLNQQWSLIYLSVIRWLGSGCKILEMRSEASGETHFGNS
jgi:hypothetical protein